MSTETKVVVAVVLTVLFFEGAMRILEPWLSNDVRNMLTYKDMGLAVKAAEIEGRTVIVVVGNSLIRSGISSDLLESELVKRGYRNPAIFFLTPDASGVNEWAASYRKHFVNQGIVPDFFILGTGPGHLLDHPVRSPEKLAAYHCSSSDCADVFVNWLRGGNERGRFLMARISSLFANRERIRPILFYNFVPGYEVASRRLNASSQGGGGSEFQVDTASRYQGLLQSASIPSGSLLIVPVPLPTSYRLPEIVVSKTLEAEGVIVETGPPSNWPESAFPDGYHLSPNYADELTKILVDCFPPPSSGMER